MKTIRIALFGALMLAALIAISDRPAIAQTAAPTASANCNPAAVIAIANALKSTGDPRQDSANLLALAAQIDASNTACFGLTLSGTGKKVVPPFTIPAGLYRATLTTTTDFTAKPTVISGNCGAPMFYTPAAFFYAISEGAATGIDTTIQSDGCQLVLTVDQVKPSPWTITLNPLQ